MKKGLPVAPDILCSKGDQILKSHIMKNISLAIYVRTHFHI